MYTAANKPFPQDFYTQEQTKVHCWWDCHPFSGPPVGMPTRLRKSRDGSDKFVLRGCFCGRPCARAYSRALGGARAGERAQLLACLERRQGGSHPKGRKKDLHARDTVALPRETLQKFGGMLDIRKFREFSGTYEVQQPPLTLVSPDEQIVFMFQDKARHDGVGEPLTSRQVGPVRDDQGVRVLPSPLEKEMGVILGSVARRPRPRSKRPRGANVFLSDLTPPKKARGRRR